MMIAYLDAEGNLGARIASADMTWLAELTASGPRVDGWLRTGVYKYRRQAIKVLDARSLAASDLTELMRVAAACKHELLAIPHSLVAIPYNAQPPKLVGHAARWVDGVPWTDSKSILRETAVEERADAANRLRGAIEALNRAGVFHGDLSPLNVRVCQRGASLDVAVIDFDTAWSSNAAAFPHLANRRPVAPRSFGFLPRPRVPVDAEKWERLSLDILEAQLLAAQPLASGAFMHSATSRAKFLAALDPKAAARASGLVAGAVTALGLDEVEPTSEAAATPPVRRRAKWARVAKQMAVFVLVVGLTTSLSLGGILLLFLLLQ